MPDNRRVLLKLSGEALAGTLRHGIDFPTVDDVSIQIQEVVASGLQVALVVGAGNIWRGSDSDAPWIDRAQADYMGMLATVINAMAIQGTLERHGVASRVQSAIEMNEVAEPYIRRRAIRHLEKGRVVIFAGGTGNPYFTTDTAASLRAVEIGASIVYKATRVDGVYSADPEKDPNAVRYDRLTFRKVIADQLRVMDQTAVTMCMENNLPIVIFDMTKPRGIVDTLLGKNQGTLVSTEG